MNSSYLDRYTMVQIFKENEFQKVFIGTDNNNNQAVVINTIYTEENDSIWDLVYQSYRDTFNHVLHFEKMKDQIVLVTKVEEGLSLNAYLNDFSPTFTERVNLIYQYLNGIRQYDLVPNNVKSILVDESQIIINKGKISFDELVIFNENSFKNKNFEAVMNNIVLVLKKLTSLQDINYEELPLYIKTMGFLDELQRKASIYNNINEILNEFETLNIGSLPISNTQENIITYNSTNLVGRKVGSIKEEDIIKKDTHKKRLFTIAISTAGVIAVVLVGAFILKPLFPIDKTKTSDVVISSKDATDMNANNPEENKEMKNIIAENNDEEAIGPNKNIDYLSEYIEKDFTTSKYGDYSFKFSSENQNSHKISINQGPIKANSQLLMWVKLDTSDEIKIAIEGYSNSKLSFQQSISHKPLYVNSWELIQLTLNQDIEDSIDIIFNNIDSTVWVDKISIDIFK